MLGLEVQHRQIVRRRVHGPIRGDDVDRGSFDTAPLAGAIIELLFDETLRRRLAGGANAMASRYDWGAVSRSFENVLASAVEANASEE